MFDHFIISFVDLIFIHPEIVCSMVERKREKISVCFLFLSGFTFRDEEKREAEGGVLHMDLLLQQIEDLVSHTITGRASEREFNHSEVVDICFEGEWGGIQLSR